MRSRGVTIGGPVSDSLRSSRRSEPKLRARRPATDHTSAMRANSLGYRVPLFPRDTYRRRREMVAEAVKQAGLDVLLVTVPENIYYLIGLDHFGYFAFHMLAVPAEGEPVLVARRMEHVTIGRDVPDLRFEGYGDNEDLPEHCVKVVESLAPSPSRIGMEETSLYLIPTVALAIREHFPR